MIREVVLRSPVVLRRGPAECRDCSFDAEEGRHTTTPEECASFNDGRCPEPSAHHPYRPRRWPRVRLMESWESWL